MPDTDKTKAADLVEKGKNPESEKSEHAGIFHTPKITACRLKYSTAFWLFFFGSIGGFILGEIADQVFELPCSLYHKSTSKYCRSSFSTRNICA